MITKNLAKAVENIGFTYVEGASSEKSHAYAVYGDYLVTVYEESGKKVAYFNFRFPESEENDIKKYDIQTVEINPNDVILLHISSNLSLRDIQAIEKEVRSEFPENRVLVVNRQVLEGMTVLRKGTTEVSLIENPVDVNQIFDEIMKGHPNGFLH